jgi:hypothetical protein
MGASTARTWAIGDDINNPRVAAQIEIIFLNATIVF